MHRGLQKPKIGEPIFKIQVPNFEVPKELDDSKTRHKNNSPSRLTSMNQKSNGRTSVMSNKARSVSRSKNKSVLSNGEKEILTPWIDDSRTKGDDKPPSNLPARNPERIVVRIVSKPEQKEKPNPHDSEGEMDGAGSGNIQATKQLARYDCWEDDLKPQEWVERCRSRDGMSHAKSPIYVNYNYVWVDVRVLDYDEDKKKFLIQICENEMMKYVGRLSLIFHDEDADKFKERVDVAKQRQLVAEDEMRFYRYVDSLPNSDAPSLGENSKKSIIGRILKKKKKGEDDFNINSLSTHITDVEKLYKLHSKKFNVIKDMEDIETHQKYKDLRIKIREKQNIVPYYNLFVNLDYEYEKTFNDIKSKHVSSKKSWTETVNMIAQKSYQYHDYSIFAINPHQKDIPFSLEDFIETQRQSYALGCTTLRNQWRDYLLGEIQDILRNTYNFYSVGKGSYFETEMQSFMLKLDFIFNTYVRTNIVQHTIENWLTFLRKFNYPEPAENANIKDLWQISDKPLLITSIKYRKKKKKEDDKKKQKDKKKDKDKDKDKEAEEEKEEETDEDDDGEMIYFSPSKDRVLKGLLKPIEWLLELVNSINKLEPDLVPFLYIPKTVSYPLTIEDEFIQKAVNRVKEMVEIGFKEPTDIINKFKKYQYIFEKVTINTPKTLFADGRPTPAKIKEVLYQLNEAMRNVGSLCINEKNCHFFQVQTENIKTSIISKATETFTQILTKVAGLCAEMVDNIHKGYTGVLNRLSVDPQNEKELVDLKDEIATHEKKIEEFEIQVKHVTEYLDILEDNLFKYEDEQYGNYWNLKTMPSEIRILVIESQKKASNQEARFGERLEHEKEKFVQELRVYEDELQRISKFDNYSNRQRNIQAVGVLKEKLSLAQDTVKSFNERESLLKLPTSDYESLTETIQKFDPFMKMWELCSDFDSSSQNWQSDTFSKLNYTVVEKKMDGILRETQRLTKLFSDASEEATLVLKELKVDIDKFRFSMPLIELLTTEAMHKTPKAWTEIFERTGLQEREKEIMENFTLNFLVEIKLLEHREILEEVSKRVEKQYGIDKKLSDMNEKVRGLSLELIPHKSGINLIKTVEEVQQILDDSLNVIQMLKASPYIKNILKKATEIEHRFFTLQEALENWMKCQRGWLYLEPIFSSEDIVKKLPNEQRKFEVIDKFFRNAMDLISKEPKQFDSPEIDFEKINVELDNHNKTLEIIQKALTDYLEIKRKDFARFYFLSDEELLEILSQTKDPTKVQPHMSKCFEAIAEVEFNSEQEVVAMISSEKEKVKFLKAVNVNEGDKKGNVEKWLTEVEIIMQKTLQNITKDSYNDKAIRTEWIRKWPGQVILAVNTVRWTTGAEIAIMRKDEQDLDLFLKHLNKELDDVVDLVRGDLSTLERLTLGALVVIDVHARDVIADLTAKGIESTNDFDWTSQLRYYWSEKELRVEMINAAVKYNFEYLGNSSRLVITPLTDRCYRTLLGAFYLQYGGAPEGPAGTGKTESVKDLAKAVAIMCVVFNCSDTLNYLSMRKFFKGLASSGGWCCFDEFNRIDLEVLSVIAQQVLQIQDAIKRKRKSFMFDGEDLKLVLTCAINITMNPGYAGRSELPDNLKALFRPCAMMVPDYSLISEIMLYSYGFKEARILAKKVVASLKLSSEQLSTQQHYDFGMRAVKAILTAAGQLKRHMKAEEGIICMRALYDVNLPKFTMNDIPLFLSITSDLFPGIKMPDPDYEMLENALTTVIEEANMCPEKAFLKKCIQLYETIMVRHGLMLVGAAFSGKSKVIESLQRAMNYLKGQKDFTGAFTYKLNPKSIKIEQLYGKFDPDSKAWSDGVLCLLMRLCTSDAANPERKWLLFDGPVDAVWIENMNTVLDDNKKLCLTSGEIIKMTPQMTMMFEVEDLLHASPATVSRCGMVYLETKNLGWEALLKAFIKQISKNFDPVKDFLFSTLRWFLDITLAYVRKFGKFPMQISEMNMAFSTLNLVDILLKPSDVAKLPKEIEDTINNVAFFACVWGIGATMEEDCRPGFHDYCMKLLACNDVVEMFRVDPDHTPFEPRAYKLKLNDCPSIFDVTYDINKGLWINWTQTIPVFQVPKSAQFHELIIPTNESLRTGFLMNLLVRNSKHILFTGPTGTGKTISIINELNINFSNDEYINLTTCFSGQTQANQVQRTIESKVVKRRKGVFGPLDGKKFLVVFIDDVNMPIKERYDAQPPIELLRQWMDYGGWYDLDTKEFKTLIDLVFVAAMGPPSAGRNSITNRYSRHYMIHYVEPFSTTSLKKIFSNVLEWYYLNLSNLSKGITSMRDMVVASTIELYNKIKSSKELLPTPAKSHYVYNLRDISKVFQGISKASLRSYIEDNDFIKLWAHECMRVFQDRLISEADREFMNNLLKDLIKTNFKKDWSSLVTIEPLLYASFVPTIYPDGDTSKKPMSNIYCELTNREAMKKETEAALESYNSFTTNKMTLVLFTNAIEHIIKIVRVISTAFGHSLLVGVGGSGRRSLATLATSIAGFDLFQVEINKGYDQKAWNEDLMKVLKLCGVEMKPQVFLFTDTQIWKEGILEDISSLLNNGEVPNLFPIEERAKIIDEMSNFIQSGTVNQKWNYFVSKCKENLHLVICLSPVGEAFRRRLRTFPSLVNCTTIDWFLPWPEEALRSVAVSVLKDMYSLDDKVKEGIIDICVDMQSRVTALSLRYYQELRKYYYVTPTSYLELLAIFKRLLEARNTKVTNAINRYLNGLQKLLSTEQEVSKMQVELIELTPQLEKKGLEAQQMIVTITEENKVADVQKEICLKEEAECNIQKEEAETLRADCKQELDKVLPILREAEEALDAVDKNELNTLKSYQKVVAPIEVTMKAMCIMKGITAEKKKEGMTTVEDWWGSAKKKLLNNIDALMKDVRSYDVKKIASIDSKTIAKLKEFFSNPDFEEKTVYRASGSAASLSKWIRAVVQTYEAYLVVDPKQKQLEGAEASLKKAEETLAQKRAQLQAVLDKIADLQRKFEQTKLEKETLEAKCEKCKIQINRATQLTEGLASEKKMWRQRADDLKEDSKSITGDILLSSGMIAYMGAFPLAYREECQKVWEGLLEKYSILKSPEFKLRTILSDEVTIGNWNNKYKLPNDSISVDNAIILFNATRYALMIDPQLQANRWIKELEKGTATTEKADTGNEERAGRGRHDKEKSRTRLQVLRPTQSANDIASILEQSISQGFPVLLENVDENIDPIFDSVLSQKKVRQGGSWKMKFGDGLIDYSPDFRLYITTKLPRPHYPPEICVKVTLLNFTVTPEGLEDNMLNIVVKAEEPLMEEKRQNNIIEFFKNQERQKQTEDNILQMLSEATGNILDKEDLVETLKKSKVESVEIENKLNEQKKDNEKFAVIRNFYQKVAKRVSALFFVVADLANIEPVYQYSLDWYIGLFQEGIATSERKKEQRCEKIIEKFQEILYDNVCRSLLEKDKLLFSFLVCMKIMVSNGTGIPAELRFLMVGSTRIDCSKPNPADGWLASKQWAGFLELVDSFPEKFSGFDSDFELNTVGWKNVFNHNDPYTVDWPAGWSKKLSTIQKLMVLRILRPDKVISGLQDLILKEMGPHYIEGSGPLDLQAVYKDSERNVNDPIIFILSPGVDPIADIYKLAEKMNMLSSVMALSLGQGQDKAAIRAIDLGAQEGRWVVLQNCHLAPSFMPQLERKIELLTPESNENYRMWLTTMPSDKFPVSILQNGIKLTNEPPKGLRNNLLRSYRGQDPKTFPDTSPQYRKLLFGLCFFHAHVQERKKFGPLGWNIPYEFNSADLAISASQLYIFLTEFPEIPYEALNYMVAEANYGGRVTDPMDRRLIKVILRDFYTEEILDDKYRFSPSGVYYAPPDGTLESYRDFLKDLPINDLAEIFGLHQNAEISSAINETNQLLGTALSLQPRTVAGGGRSSEDIIKEKCAAILAKLPKPFKIDEVIKKYPVMYEESMNTVLQQELLRFNRLLKQVVNSLEQLGKAIEGLVVMSNELDEVFNKMFDNLVPDLWHKVAYPSRKPLGSWINDLIERLNFMQKWIDEGPPPSFWISGFYFTQSFLTGTLQNYARKTQIAIDTLAFDFYVIKREGDTLCDVKYTPDNGCYVYGLFLDGCRWDDKDMVLAEPYPKILNYQMPYIWLIPKKQDDIDKEKHVYDCPVYKTSRRAGTLSTTGHSTNFVLNMLMPMAPEHDQKHWIKRGVAMLTQLDD